MVATLFLDYDKSFRRNDFRKSIKLFSKETKNILKKYYRLLLPI